MTTADATYNGETKPRSKWVAIALTYLCPGLGYMYVGEFIKGLTVNLLFLLMLEVFIISFSILKFFPLLPFLVVVAAWLIFSTLIAMDIAQKADRAGDRYVLKGYNHWTIYLVVFLLSFLVPIVLTLDFTRSSLWTLERVENGAMYPTIQPGDTVLVDLNAFREAPPVRGEVVATAPSESDDLQFLRVVGVQDDVVRMEGNTLYVNDEAVGHSPLKEEEIAHAELDKESGLLAWVEHNQGERYVISVSPRVYTELTMPPTRLASDEYFLLADNRSQVPIQGVQTEERDSQIRDSRNFGKVSGPELAGVPRFIFWSRGPDGSIRWDRIGLRVH
ncbi:signal peptidase I [Persicimonas caeni]|uniref:signal peptidase I n=1 Tax=Persicimonas caeni TaxID=2292766 RepID=UPI00143D07FA|nr:signal peptidase I [Persicimonas caeni]